MIDLANNLLCSIGHFSNAEVLLFTERAVQRTFKKNDMLLTTGEVCNAAFYIISGEAYQFYYNDIDEQVIDLHMAKDWCINHASFVSRRPATANIKAYSDLVTLELSMTLIHDLIALSPSFLQMGRVLEQTVSRINYFDNASNAQEKYQHLFTSKPDLFQQFPLKMIASYLKIAPETLSRIRGIK